MIVPATVYAAMLRSSWSVVLYLSSTFGRVLEVALVLLAVCVIVLAVAGLARRR
jgi:hypothetical protein